jgi:hypothetical protein
VIRGGRVGTSLTTLATLTNNARSWTSPTLQPGSYVVEVIARNLIGDATPTRIAFSVDETELPGPATDLIAAIADDVAHLEWQPGAGAAPASYVIEASTAGSSEFVAVTRTTMPMLDVTSVPAGSWDVRVRAGTAAGLGPPSSIVNLTSRPCSIGPSAPTLDFTQSVSLAIVTLRWSTPSLGSASDYFLEVGSRRGATDLAMLPTGGPGRSLQVSAPTGLYFVRVRARNACGVPSNEVVIGAVP